MTIIRLFNCSSGVITGIISRGNFDEIRYRPDSTYGNPCEDGLEHFVLLPLGHDYQVGERINLGVWKEWDTTQE